MDAARAPSRKTEGKLVFDLGGGRIVWMQAAIHGTRSQNLSAL